MRVLVIGSGGREHTLVWKIAQSKQVEKIYCAPGNAGIAELAELVPISVDELEKLAEFAQENKVDLTVVGPEAPLCAGIVDVFESKGLKVFGPSKSAARLEGSKIFSKELMKKYGISTAEFEVFDNADDAKKYLDEKGAPIVVKADGLAAGKGVIICKTKEEAMDAVDEIMVEKRFGGAGDKLIVEEMLEGEEASILAFSDGKNVQLMPSSQDHKRIFDNDEGPNTGGMGAYSPAPVITKEMEERALNAVMIPTVKAMEAEGAPYKGVLYAGLMISGDVINVIEFNVRFGDPEAQAVLPRLDSDLIVAIDACVDGTLADEKIIWSENPATCVVMASGGYPGKYEKGIEIFGLEEANALEGVTVFHAGTKSENEKIVTNGGRVLGVTATGSSVKESIERAYEAVSKINFEGAQYRKDIGRKALERD
ncbi:MAG: phosphoribosylamine--glycine ligase [Candidatus Diapherotrites archaeon]